MADTPDKSESTVLGPDTGAAPIPVPIAAPVAIEAAVEAPAPAVTIEKPLVASQETPAEATTADVPAPTDVAPKDDNAIITDSTADNLPSAPVTESVSAPAQADPSQGADTEMGEPANTEAAVETNQQEASANQDIETDGPTKEGAESSQANSSSMETDPEATVPAADASADLYTEQDEAYKGTELVSSVPAPSETAAGESKSDKAKPSTETTGEGQSVGSLTKAAPVPNANPTGKQGSNHHPHSNNNYGRPYQRGGRGGFNNRYGYQNNSRNFNNNQRPFNNNNPNHQNNNNMNNDHHHQHNNHYNNHHHNNNNPNHHHNSNNFNNHNNHNNGGNNGNLYNNNNGPNNHHGGPGPMRRGGFRGKEAPNLIFMHDHSNDVVPWRTCL
jgi:hypothetical protein